MDQPLPPRFFESLVSDLTERSSSAILGIYGPRADPLRHRLAEVLARPAGQPGSFLADPVFEAIFDWKRADATMRKLAESGLLTRELVKAMDRPPQDDSLAQHRFPAHRRPFTHQLDAWKHLKRQEARSVLITSGTGSGKTEGFLVPILDDLARQSAGSRRLSGVRALFLYPLNALINSQKDRLSAWSRPFKGRIRYCLYKGDTPEKLSGAQRKRLGPELVADRHVLRDDPPPILVTNSTMLEYMLVRAVDKPIIEQSQGKLRWIVLDEAHTYQGSRSAEIALLLRRVLHAFGVKPSQVRFVATSATIGDDSSESDQRLTSFLADLSGVPADRVHVVRGERDPPVLQAPARDRPLPRLRELRQMSPAKRRDALASSKQARRIRRGLLQSPNGARTLTDLTKIRLGSGGNPNAPIERRRTLELLDLATASTVGDDPFLRVRGHLFHRTQGGAWACISNSCPGRKDTPLDDFEWPFGKLFFERRKRCDQCDSLVLAVVLCAECGTACLAGTLRFGEEGRFVEARDAGTLEQSDDLLELDLEEEEYDPLELEHGVEDGCDELSVYLAHPATPELSVMHLDPKTGREIAEGHGSVSFAEVRHTERTKHPRCPECGTSRRPDWLLRALRGGASLMLRNTIPVVLGYTPRMPADGERRPSDGRRLLTFTDSRQGTARFALDAQLDAERNYVRSMVYHLVAASRSGNEDADKIEALKRQVADLEPFATRSPALRDTLSEKRRELADAEAPTSGKLSWDDAVEKLSQETVIAKWLRQHMRHLPLSELKPGDLARIALLREFARRPKRQNSLETLGFVAVDYRGLAAHPSAPPPWKKRGLPTTEWRSFLKIALDYVVRGRRAIDVAERLVPWLGVPHRPTVLIGPGRERFDGAVKWPLASPRTMRSRLVQILAKVLGTDPKDGPGSADIDNCLLAAWRQILPVLEQSEEGRHLNLSKQVVLREVRDAGLCPMTRRVLDTTVMGLTPYVTPDMDRGQLAATAIRMPRLKRPFWRTPTDAKVSKEEIAEVIRSDPDIGTLKDLGAWHDLSSRIFAQVEYFQVAEHSAQIPARRLGNLEERFRNGRINVLSSSTTMELGVDIGGLSAVAMNTAPPSPANYLQRAGRSGRRQESRAFCLTLCNTSQHGEWVFRNPLWPFETGLHVTTVGLHSERIVQRHVNALALARFFAEKEVEQELHRLTARAFFEGDDGKSSACEHFRRWLRDEAHGDSWMTEGVKRLLRCSVLEGAEPERLMGAVERRIAEAASGWLSELDPLVQELAGLSKRAETDPARRAVEIQLRRLRGEYLLKELALRNFLPGYGFPTQVVPFVTTTRDDVKHDRRRREADERREDNLFRGRQYPTRDLATALMEYAPGSNIVFDGRVLRSSGLTLNWKIPVGDEPIREIQARCGMLGDAVGAARSA